jgi:hypothetical protein
LQMSLITCTNQGSEDAAVHQAIVSSKAASNRP